MLKKLKIGTKLWSGFLVVLALTCAVGYVGYSGLNDTATIVDKADDANRLIKYAKDCRRQQRSFMLLGEEEYQEENDATMKQIYDQIDTTMAKLNDPADREMLSEVEQAAKAYKTNFDEYVTLWGRQEKQEESMVKNAQAFITECQALKKGQEEKADTALLLANRIPQISRDHMKWATGVREFLMHQTANELSVEKDGHECSLGKWLNSEQFKKEERVAGEQFRQMVDHIRADHMKLHESAKAIEQARRDGEDATKLFETRTRPLLEGILGVFNKMEEEANRVYKTKLANAESANTLISLAEECRRQEKNFIIRHDKRYQ